MKYKVTFENGQVNVYDTPTPLDEFKGQFTSALNIEVLEGAPKVSVVEHEPEVIKKVVRKNAAK